MVSQGKLYCCFENPFTDGALVKECSVECEEILCPSPVSNFEIISMTEQKVSRRILELGADLKEQLRENVPILCSIL
ncbi:unnamed protein product [Acanthoscelides obtectus]|uniref:Uncharacterized protein n=1 Tax=Acanthoscelides obtectus TaxID=200917 RepID=A0A9P0MF98_ACAOB|nr:unnamed protein product [Acanthoscelides obtectus]CAK1687832.1 hypothetical protein AOBTE_LOCUS36396 [Acanthoscelides obtectus]